MAEFGGTWNDFMDTPRWAIEGLSRVRRARAEHANTPAPTPAADPYEGPVIT